MINHVIHGKWDDHDIHEIQEWSFTCFSFGDSHKIAVKSSAYKNVLKMRRLNTGKYICND